MTYYETCRMIQEGFEDAGVPEPAIDARYLVEFVSGFGEAEYLLKRNEQIPAQQYARIGELAARRMKREPLQYIIGSQEFMGLPFICTKDCLIPRQDTEILVERAMKAIGAKGDGVRVLDLCTGSGCIIISLAVLCGLKNAQGIDISEAALDVARRNATENRVDVEFMCSDLFSAVEGRYDVITANPPYIDTGLIHGLIPEIWKYEPMVALDGGEDGLIFYRKITEQAPDYLKKDGMLLFEIGDTQGDAVAEIMRNRGFREVSVHRDLAGMHRVVEGRY